MEEVKTQKILYYNGTYVKDRKYGLVNDYLTYEENPILYILCVADALEPIKAYAEIPKEIILNSLDIDYTPQSKQIKFSTLSTNIDINVLYKKAKDLENWTSVKCNRVGDTSFSIEL